MKKFYIIALIVIIIDQITKVLIVSKMALYESIPVLGNFFFITSHRNRGAAWGILQEQMIFFYIITIVVVIGLIYYAHKEAKQMPIMKIGLAMILGGALGNFIDRLFRKEVVDFLDVMIINYDFPIFNIADSALTIGVVIVFIALIFNEEEKKGKKVS